MEGTSSRVVSDYQGTKQGIGSCAETGQDRTDPMWSDVRMHVFVCYVYVIPVHLLSVLQ